MIGLSPIQLADLNPPPRDLQNQNRPIQLAIVVDCRHISQNDCLRKPRKRRRITAPDNLLGNVMPTHGNTTGHPLNIQEDAAQPDENQSDLVSRMPRPLHQGNRLVTGKCRFIDKILVCPNRTIKLGQHQTTGRYGGLLGIERVELSGQNIGIDERPGDIQFTIDCRFSGPVWPCKNGADRHPSRT